MMATRPNSGARWTKRGRWMPRCHRRKVFR